MELVMLHNNEPVTTSLAIAEGVGMPHKSVIQLVRKYSEDLLEFGPSAFETRVGGNSAFEMPNSRNARGRPTEVSILNEPQATLLLTYMRNSPVVRQFKKALVRAFFELRRQLEQQLQEQPPASMPENGQADRLINAGRVFREMIRMTSAANRAGRKTLETANAFTREATGLDMLDMLDRAGWERAGTVALPDRRLEELQPKLAAWLGEQGGSEYSTDTLMREALDIHVPTVTDYALLSDLMQALDWKAVRLRAGGVQRRGYRKQGTPVRDELAERLAAWVAHQDGDFTLADAVRAAVDTDDATASRELQTRVGLILSRLGCAKMEKRGSSPRYWYRRAA